MGFCTCNQLVVTNTQVKDCRNCAGPDIDSDHNMVLRKCQLKFKLILRTYHMWNVEKLRNAERAATYKAKTFEF